MRAEKFDLSEEMSYWNIPGTAVAVSCQDAMLCCAGQGVRDIEKDLPVDKNTKFCIASCTKSYTAAVAVMLQQEGKLDLKEPVVKYLPEFQLKDEYVGKNLCMQDMLTHVCGLPGHDFMWPYYDIPDDEFIRRLKYLDFTEAFRTKAQYNNVMYILAGIVEERVTGKKWGELVKEKIFGPLGMNNSYVSLEEAYRYSDRNISEGYLYDQGKMRKLISIAPRERASGSIVMGIEDMMKWLKFQMTGLDASGNILLSQEQLDLLHDPKVIYSGKPYAFEKDSMPVCYALGWFVREYRGHRIVYHHGGTLGFCSLQAFVPESNFMMAVLENSHGIGDIYTDALLFAAIDKVLFGEDTFAEWREKYHGMAESTSHYINLLPQKNTEDKGGAPFSLAGRYENNAYGKMKIWKEKEQYYLGYKDFVRPLLVYGRVDGAYVYYVDGLIADTEFYTLPLSFTIDQSTQKVRFEIPLEAKVKPIVFTRV